VRDERRRKQGSGRKAKKGGLGRSWLYPDRNPPVSDEKWWRGTRERGIKRDLSRSKVDGGSNSKGSRAAVGLSVREGK
jgi:hypothetical protein